MAINEALLEFSRHKHHVIGLAILRIVAGVTLAFEYLHVHQQRHYLFGPLGVSPTDHAQYSLYTISDHPLYFELVFHLGVLVTVFWTLGFHTRLTTPLTLAFWWSLAQLHPGLWDGGHNLIQLVLIYCCFADVGGFGAMTDRANRSASQTALIPQLATLTHNAAVLAIAIQLSILYAVAGATKFAGASWQNGTALYYALRPEEFYLPGISELLWSSREGLTIAAYATMYIQFSFPLMFFLNAKSRRLVIGLMLGFHLGILLVMGLITFALFMIATDLCLIGDDEYRAAYGWVKASTERVRMFITKMQPIRRRHGTPYIEEHSDHGASGSMRS